MNAGTAMVKNSRVSFFLTFWISFFSSSPSCSTVLDLNAKGTLWLDLIRNGRLILGKAVDVGVTFGFFEKDEDEEETSAWTWKLSVLRTSSTGNEINVESIMWTVYMNEMMQQLIERTPDC
mmetsp:Transcript_15234/g.28672  ORF Transcript_15234/g.28672 Transcript_15234/m.28672 type:complete len:121 (-) Transcript_15234:170-532(-)